jgi:hypothetical protein
LTEFCCYKEAPSVSDWVDVVKETDIPIDLQHQELNIETESLLGSGDMIRVDMFTESGEYISNVQIMFNDQMEYHVGWCSVTHDNRFDRTPSVTNPSTWKIEKNGAYNLRIWCNDVLVLTYTFASSSRSTCVPKFSKDVGMVSFRGSEDTSSKRYKPVIGMYVIIIILGRNKITVGLIF